MKKPASLYLLLTSSIITTSFLAGCESQTTIIPDLQQTQSTSTLDTMPIATGDTQIKVPQVLNTGIVPSENAPTAAAKESITVSTYKDGNYTSSGSYIAPSGNENVSFAFTVKNDQITGLNLVSSSSNPVSSKFQGMFIDGIKQLVVGKKISELGSFSRVNGSSLTPSGFNAALSQLKAQAKA